MLNPRLGQASGGVKVTAIPVLRDNYVWCLDNGCYAYVVDPGESGPVVAFLNRHQLRLEGILLTHHHQDHIGGVADLLENFDSAGLVKVYAPMTEAIPLTRQPLLGGEEVYCFGLTVEVLSVAAHTRGHLAYYLPAINTLFCGDALFGAGCGRLFEGTARDLLCALKKLRSLPSATKIYCAHEYTLANLQFAQAVEPDNPTVAQRIIDTEILRANGESSVPSLLIQECATNPFLRWDVITVQQAAQAFDPQIDPQEAEAVLGAIRRWKDRY